jgi:outer membrane receptor protein involved in Fe transport
VVASLLLAVPRNALAQNTSDLEGALDQSVVTTASMTAESESSAPATSTVITADQLRRYGLHSVAEAINFFSLGMVTQNPLIAEEVGARGVLISGDFGGHVLVLVNGHALTDPGFGVSYVDRGLGIPIGLIDHIEIILGPGSVLYGANAMLGVINIITKRAKDYAGFHVVGEGELMAPSDRQGTFLTPSFGSSYTSDLGTSYRVGAGVGRELKLFGKPAEITFQAEYYKQSGPTLVMGPQFVGNDPFTGKPKRYSPDSAGTGIWGGRVRNAYYTEVPTGYLRLFWGDFELNTRASAYRRGDPYINSVISTFSNFDATGTREIDKWISFDLKHRWLLSSRAELRSRAYFDNYSYNGQLDSSAAGDCFPGENSGCVGSLPQLSRSVGVEEQVSLDWLKNATLVTLVGVEGRLRHTTARIDIFDRVTGVLGGTVNDFTKDRQSLGAYVQQTALPLSWLSLNAGARADVVEHVGSKVSPRVAANVLPWKGGTLKAIYAEAFRAPTEFEQNFNNPFQQIAAGKLRPETVRSVEGSIEQRFGAQRILFGVFKSWWSDLVVRNIVSRDDVQKAIANGDLLPSANVVLQYQNVSSIDNYGFNAAYSGTLLEHQLEYGLNVTGAYARRELPSSPSQPLTVAPQFFGNAHVAYDFQNDLPTVALAAHYVDTRPADRAFDGGFTPTPYASSNLQLRGAVSGPIPWVRGFSYRLTTEYAFASFSAYVAGPIQNVAPGGRPTAAELAPIVRFRTSLGLEYNFGSNW